MNLINACPTLNSFSSLLVFSESWSEARSVGFQLLDYANRFAALNALSLALPPSLSYALPNFVPQRTLLPIPVKNVTFKGN